ncbi:TPA: hypothetical protein ACLE2C_003579 [Bacillus paranthracis]|uniref:hypothetical protein n=1 Tax=Bacillus paranthracis TaxID=2026186 RepID=UPI00254EDA49|nr:hypothetical protein [Bacillus paranthracis]MDK7475180.1 hypothetical protein [Bacillus paranthracis]BCC18524.1 hypothetical protein BCM0075_3294 [Bacillus cereus]
MTNIKNRKGAGRKKALYDEQVILDLIYSCIEEKKIIGQVKYQIVHPYCLGLYEEKKINFKLSEDYWRKPGRQGTELLTKVNRVVIDQVEVDKHDIVNVVNTEDAINKLYDGKRENKKKLLDTLKLNEVKLKKYINECKRLENKVDMLGKDLILKKQDAQEWKNKAEELQRQLFLIMEYSASENFPIVNILNTGRTRTEAVTKQLESLFGDNPTIGYEYEQYMIEKREWKEPQKSVVSIPNRKGKSAADDFGFL